MDGTARDQRGQIGDRQRNELMREDVVEPLLAIQDLRGEASVPPFSDFSQEYAGCAARVEKRGTPVVPQVEWKRVEHVVSNGGWSKNVIAAEILQTGTHVRFVSHVSQHGRGPENA
jgi:hypothetical protein